MAEGGFLRFFRRRRIDDIFHEAIRKQKYKFVFCAIALNVVRFGLYKMKGYSKIVEGRDIL